jgi:hypothetical protein
MTWDWDVFKTICLYLVGISIFIFSVTVIAWSCFQRIDHLTVEEEDYGMRAFKAHTKPKKLRGLE